MNHFILTKATTPTINQRLPSSFDSPVKRSLAIHALQNKVTFDQPHEPQSLSSCLQPHIEIFHRPCIDWKALQHYNQTAPESPKGDISSRWREIHGSSDWNNLLDPLCPELRQEIIKYGEFAQATYDAFEFDPLSEYCGSCKYHHRKLFDKLGLTKHGYMVSKNIYAMSHIDVPRWLERMHLVDDTWSKYSNWMGYVGISNDEESCRIGRRDIVVAWRGTMSSCEWYEDLQWNLKPIGDGDGDVKVEHGFHDIYTSKGKSSMYNKSSASEQVLKEVTRLVTLCRARGEEVSLTISGHSLGGALAHLNAYEAAMAIPDLPICVISFGSPRVGNKAFKETLNKMGVKTLRIVVKQDLVHRMPGTMFNDDLDQLDEICCGVSEHYSHVGVKLKLDVQVSPYLKKAIDLKGFHNLEIYLHLVDGFQSSTSAFRPNFRRDLALVNKASGMLVDELKIPKCWYQLANKGLVTNSYGKWVRPEREPEDIPSPDEDIFTRSIYENFS